MPITFKHLLVALLMIAWFLPLHASGAEAIKLRFTSSLYADAKGEGLKQPEGVGCVQDKLAVADTGNGRLVLYSMQAGDPKGGTEVKLPQILYPIKVRMTSTGDILVLDERQRKIVRLTGEGAFKGYVEPSGLPDQGMIVPVGLDLDGNDNIYLLDILSARVLVLNTDGKYERQIDFPKGYGFITDLTVDRRRTVYLIDSVRAQVYSNAKDAAVFSPMTGTMKDDMKFPTNIATDNNGTFYITDQNGSGIVIINQNGALRGRQLSFGWKEGLVRYPAQLCVTKDGSIVVADRENNRVQIFTPLK
jgi:hypothetical protein